MKKYHKWTPADDHYLRDNRENTSLEELASHLKVSEIAVERRLSRLKIYVGKSWRPPGKKMGRPAKPKENLEPIVSKEAANVDKLWQAQKMKNKQREKSFKSIERDFTKMKAVRIDNKTFILIEPSKAV